MTALFWALAAGLAIAGIGFLTWPLLRPDPPASLDRRGATLAAHRARLAEIEAGEEGAAGDPATIDDARDDVARSLLSDLDPDDRPAPEPPSDRVHSRPRRGAAVILGIAFPLLGVGLYLLLGEPRALAPPVSLSAAAIGAEVERLLAEAEAIALTSDDRLEGEPARLIEQALLIAPDHRKTLWFAAVAALHEDRGAVARDRLERLKELGPFDETQARMYERLMKEAESRLSDP